METATHGFGNVRVKIRFYSDTTKSSFYNLGPTRPSLRGRTANTKRDGTPYKTRGKVTVFSDKSRRALRLICDNVLFVTFITFTYAKARRPKDGKSFKEDGERLARLLRESENYAVIVKEVARARYGLNPHFHVLTTQKLSTKESRVIWARCLGVEVKDLNPHATRTKSVYDALGASKYVYKTLGKNDSDGTRGECKVYDEAFGSVGKWFNEVNKHLKPQPVEFDGSLPEMAPLLRTLHKAKVAKVRDRGGSRKLSRGGGLRGETVYHDQQRSFDHMANMERLESKSRSEDGHRRSLP